MDGRVALAQERTLEVGGVLGQQLTRCNGLAVQESELGEPLTDAVGQRFEPAAQLCLRSFLGDAQVNEFLQFAPELG